MLAIQPTELRCRSITIDTFRCLIPVKRSMRDCAERTNNILQFLHYIIFTLHFISFLH